LGNRTAGAKEAKQECMALKLLQFAGLDDLFSRQRQKLSG